MFGCFAETGDERWQAERSPRQIRSLEGSTGCHSISIGKDPEIVPVADLLPRMVVFAMPLGGSERDWRRLWVRHVRRDHPSVRAPPRRFKRPADPPDLQAQGDERKNPGQGPGF